MTNLKTAVIEDLVDSSFNPHEQEAYEFMMNKYSCLKYGRTGSEFLAQLEELDWKNFNKKIIKLKGEKK